jgi:hypothetical protein
VKDVKYVLVWGISSRHYPQHCGLSHVLQDEDVVQIVKKKVHKIISLFNSMKLYFTRQLYMTALSVYLNQNLDKKKKLLAISLSPHPLPHPKKKKKKTQN